MRKQLWLYYKLYYKWLFLSFSCSFTNYLAADFYCANTSSTIRLKNPNSQLILGTALDFSGTLSLRDDSSSAVIGNNINFTEGILQAGNLSTCFTGNYSTGNVNQIILSGNDSLNVQMGLITLPITVSGTGNSIAGRLFLSEEITLQDQNSFLEIAILGNLTKNINLTGGTLQLDADLGLADTVQIVGPGTIDFAGKQLTFGTSATTLTSDLILTGEVNINLFSDIILQDCSWTFTDVAGFSIINGNGNTIDLSSSGQLILAQDHVLCLNNVYVKGIGDDTTLGRFVFYDSSSVVIMRNVTLIFSNNYTLSNGQFYLQGVNSNFLVGGANFYITNDAVLSVDSIALIWDRLSLNDNSNPILPNAASNVRLLNGGYIRSINTELEPVSIYSASMSLSSNIFITSSSILTFSNSNQHTPKEIIISGNGHFIQFSRSDDNKDFIVQDNITLTLSNIVLKDFNPGCILLGNNSKIIFGDNVTLELGKDIIVNSPLNISGNVIISGRSGKLTLVDDNSLVVNTDNKTLTLQNLSIHGLGGTHIGASRIGRLRMNYPSDTIILRDVELYLDDDYLINTGALQIEGFVHAIGDRLEIIYTSSSLSTIQPEAALLLDQGLTFSYAANIYVLPEDGTESTYLKSRTRFALLDRTSLLYLNGATIHSTHTGLVLDTGTLIIKDHSILRSVAGIDEGNTGLPTVAVGEEPVLADSLTVKILAGAVFDVQGRVIYE